MSDVNAKESAENGSGVSPCYADVVVAGLSRYIGAAFKYEEEFLAKFWCGKTRNLSQTELHECYMASERTRIVVIVEDGLMCTAFISTQEFIAWVEGMLSA
jgi:hypothetical protein